MTLEQLEQKLQENLEKLSGQVALSVKFLNTNQIININEKQQIWAASVIKIPIACAFFKQVYNNKINPNERIIVSKENRVEGTGVIKLFDINDTFTYLDLVTLMLAVSDNAATNQIVDLIGWENVEIYMKEIGLPNTTFRHKMFVTEGRGPNLTTAEDIAILIEKLHKNELVGSKEIIGILKKQQDRTRIPLLLPNDIEIAHKLGSLPEAMHDVGIIYSKTPFIFVFLSEDQKDKTNTNKVLSECAKLCFDYTNS